MRIFTIVFSLFAATFFSGLAHADLTVRQSTQGTGLAAMGNGDSVTYIKGLRMRTESTVRGDKQVMILDLEKQQMTLFEAGDRKVERWNLAPLVAEQQAIRNVETSLEPAEGTKEIAGYRARKHQLRIEVESSMPDGGSLEITFSGPVWLASDAPGHEEYLRFYETMADRGLFLQPPASAQAQPAQIRGWTAMYRAIAKGGFPLASELSMRFDGSGLAAMIMGNMKMDMSTMVQSISTDSLDDSLFEAPAGAKVKEKTL